jgi:HTH-type transcriptional regulator, glycine betaine synthesis regulator
VWIRVHSWFFPSGSSVSSDFSSTNNHQPPTAIPLNSPVPIPVSEEPSSVAALQQVELEVRDLFVRAAQLVGVPKSVGEIYGLLYLSREPLSMDQISDRLKISVGSASQGLRQLRGFRAVKTVYVPGERKDFYVAEIEFRKLVAGFVKEEIRPHLESGEERLGRMKALLQNVEAGADKEHLEKQILHLDRLHGLGSKFLPLIIRLIRL